ncbi:MAG: TonB-dependent receptor [Bacteroidales bacterium]|nr:TonB-dependent receptor [Bacteroidales bacterium]
MKHLLTTLFLALTTLCGALAQTRIDGTVIDRHGPVVGVNVFVVGTLDGGITDTLGRFSFQTKRTGELTLRASMLGYEDETLAADASRLTGVVFRLREKAASIDEVVVTASTYSIGKSDRIKTVDALDVVMSGNSCGDIVAALQVLPGTQKVGENGKLYVRGGESEECQTFVNGMHVLVPYSTNVEGQSQRGRFSPFLFKGMSFSLGGYGGEYGQALSSVLPMETTDVATGDKLGVSASLVDWNVGGTKSFAKSSLSFNADLTDLGLYTKLFPDRVDWTRPYRKLSGEAQFKSELSRNVVLKTYAGYDRTVVGMRTDGRSLSMKENNVYANATVRARIGKGYTLFAGVAESFVLSDIDDALVAGDHYHNTRNEVHLKAELRKRFSPTLKMSAGVEDYLRRSGKRYDETGYDLDYNLLGAHVDANVRLIPKLFLNLSARGERVDYSREWMLMPRATLSFVPGNRFQASLMAGRYSQTPEDDYIARGQFKLRQSTADHLILSMQYSTAKMLFRVEPYYKWYHHLPLLSDGVYTAGGYGYSRGFDVYLEDTSLLQNLTVTGAYSFNDSERLYLDFTAPRTPEYASKHNLRLTAKYSLGKVILGLAETYASGRVYAAGTTPFYSSLDANITWLAHPKVIVYGSLNNLTGRTNVYRINPDGTRVTATRDRFLYIGIFVSLKNNKAYDISNF